MPLTFNDVKSEIASAVNADLRAITLWKKLTESGAGYKEAHDYALRVGVLTGRVLKKYQPEDLAEWDLEDLIPGTLGLDHAMVSAACTEAQKNLNLNAGVGIRPQVPKFDGNRAFGLVAAVKERGEIGPLFYDQVENFAENVVDQAVKDNAAFQSGAGLHPKVVRTAEAHCCEWCDNLAGVYNYEDVRDKGNDVWRRHRNCHCTIEYDPGKRGGWKEHVSGPRSTDPGKADRIYSAERKSQPQLDLQFFAHKTGDYRRMEHGDGWDELSLKETISKYARGSKPVKSEDKQKISYFSKDGKYEIKYDVKGDYFRIIDRKSESHARPCLDKNGNPVLNIMENGKQRSATPDEYDRLTHFRNRDKKGGK